MANPKQKDVSSSAQAPDTAAETPRQDFETFLAGIVKDGSPLGLERAKLVAAYWQDKREYDDDVKNRIMVLHDGIGQERTLTQNFQRSIGMDTKEADGYFASLKKWTSTTFERFWKYYDEETRKAEGRPAPNPLDSARDFEELLKIALDDGKLSDEELEAVARYLGSAEMVWKETRARVASLLDDIKDPNSSDRVLGRKFQAAIGHLETDGIIGGKDRSNTIARFWQYYAERKTATTAATPALPVAAPATAPTPTSVAGSPTDQTPESDDGLASTAELLAEALRKNAQFTAIMSQRVLAYVFEGNTLEQGENPVIDTKRLSKLRGLVAETAKRSGKTEADVARAIATKFEFGSVPSGIDEVFLRSLDKASRVVTNGIDRNGSVMRISPDSNRVRLRGPGAESFREEFRGRYVNPKLLRELFDKHVAALKNRSDDELRIDWENLARTILTKDIPSLHREKESLKGLGHQLAFMFMNVSGTASRSFAKGARETTFFDLLLLESEKNPSSTVDAATAEAGIWHFNGANERAYSHYSESVISQGGFRRTKTDAIELSTDAGQQAFLSQAKRVTKEGWTYYGGMTSAYQSRFPRMRASEIETRLDKKNAFEIAQMIVDLSRAPGTKSESERLETRSFLLIVYENVSRGILSNLDTRFEGQEGKTDRDTLLRDRETIVTRIRPIIENSIMTDADIVSKKKDRSYIGQILLPKPQETRPYGGSESFTEAQSMRRTHMLQQELDAPVLPVSVNGTVYVIESRGSLGWVVVPPMSAMLGDRGVTIPKFDKGGIASALADVDKMVRGAK